MNEHLDVRTLAKIFEVKFAFLKLNSDFFVYSLKFFYHSLILEV